LRELRDLGRSVNQHRIQPTLAVQCSHRARLSAVNFRPPGTAGSAAERVAIRCVPASAVERAASTAASNAASTPASTPSGATTALTRRASTAEAAEDSNTARAAVLDAGPTDPTRAIRVAAATASTRVAPHLLAARTRRPARGG
jgi:hypothetical protein